MLLLDDVFSELDPDRSDALLANLPAGQTLLTSASGLPPEGPSPTSCSRSRDGRIAPRRERRDSGLSAAGRGDDGADARSPAAR